MNIFLSYSFRDRALVNELIIALQKMKHIVFDPANQPMVIDPIKVPVGNELLKEVLIKTDIIIAIITEDYLSSPAAIVELGEVVLNISDGKKLLPVVVNDAPVPSYLRDHIYIAATEENLVPRVLAAVAAIDNNKLPQTSRDEKEIAKRIENNQENQIGALKKALSEGTLTLVCGAGVSRDSNIPDWNTLLIDIFDDVHSSDTSDQEQDNSATKISTKELLSSLPQSNLIIGKYLKILLNDSFEKYIQKHLYKYYNEDRDSEIKIIVQGQEPINYALESKMMRAIGELSRPKRNGTHLESIITFNFDDLIERSLTKQRIEHFSIWKEGQELRKDALPIYHVHGFLPNNENIDEPNLVFSEESYHSQFIDPYNWSNLIQLNTFFSNTCLFVGLSMSDPNLRRLLDISWRRNHRIKHYIIMRKKQAQTRADEVANMLFEQDANSLGLNVIWCSDFSEIPEILLRIAK